MCRYFETVFVGLSRQVVVMVTAATSRTTTQTNEVERLSRSRSRKFSPNKQCRTHVLIVSVTTSLERSRELRMYRLTESSSSGESGLPPFCENHVRVEKARQGTVRGRLGEIRADTIALPTGSPPEKGRTAANANRHNAQNNIPESIYHLVVHG